MLTLVLTAALVPQSPVDLEGRVEALDFTEHLRTVTRATPPRAAFARPAAPAFLRGLAGEAVLDPVLAALDMPAKGPLDLDAVHALADAVHGRPAGPQGLPRRWDLRAYEDLLEEVHQEMRRPLGTGRELYDVVPELHGALARFRALTDPGSLDREQVEILERALDRLGKVDREALYRLARRVVVASIAVARDPALRARLEREDPGPQRDDAVGDVLYDRETVFGRMVVGGTGSNTYDCSQIDVILDLGGDDDYDGPAAGTLPRRRLAVVVDMAGNDHYRALNDALGSGTYGIGVLVDLEGDDEYEGRARCAGFGAGGVGVFLDMAGADTMKLGWHSGGVGLGGYGLCVDLTGDDEQEAETQAFGLGLPTGVGVFVDGGGDDRRTVGAMEVEDPRGAARISEACGFGSGLQGVLAGGVGLYVDGAGNDEVRAEGHAFGAGAQGGLGIALELGGDDRSRGGVSSFGAGSRHGRGIYLDAAGNDHVSASGGLSLGAGAHHGQGFCVDLAGDDEWRSLGAGVGTAWPSGLGAFLDLGGADDLHVEFDGVPWPARGEVDEGLASLALFVDEGEEEDTVRWHGPHAPEAGNTKRWEDPPEHVVVRSHGGADGKPAPGPPGGK